MHARFSLIAVSGLVLLAIATGAPWAWAQAGVDIFVTPVPNLPFTGVINVARSFVQRDGSIVNVKTIRDIGRDGRGRIYNESRMLVPVANTKTPQLMQIHQYDPQTRISTILNPEDRTFSTRTVSHPPSTVPPALLYAAPMGNSLPQSEFTKEEDLGIHDMEGLPVHGVRETQTIPAENGGTGKEIVITDEYWYSDDLRINLIVKHSDPRTGSVTMTVTQVIRTEPDSARFEIPDVHKPTGTGRETDK
jgi:hypothetical protein